MVPTSPKERIRAAAHAEGFDVVGFASADADPVDKANLDAFLADGRQGDMAWMAANADRRSAPRTLWLEARTVISVAVNYGPVDDPLDGLRHPDRGAISVYARGRDYHTVVKKRLKRLGRWITEHHDCQVKVFVDTAPVMEKPLAMRAGVGWIGKHTNLVSRRFGSWLFLGEVMTTLDLPPDLPEPDHCGSCDRCLRACPTGALPEPYRIDPRLCISYQTIENKDAVDPHLRPLIGNRIYGCDDCLAVCPWNRFASPTPHPELRPRDELVLPRLAELARLADEDFRALFAGTSVKRIGRDRMVRNVMVAAGNSKEDSLAATAAASIDDRAPLVRDTARWAHDQLAGRGTEEPFPPAR